MPYSYVTYVTAQIKLLFFELHPIQTNVKDC